LADAISAWTARRSPREAEAALIAAGVPAHAVQNSGECAVDEQLAHDGHFVKLPHPEHGTVVVEGSRTTMSETPAVVEGVPPLLGQDTVDVLTEVLGYDDDRLATLFAAGAIN
jgi:benzylsuccinate CoA-transferase BbsF subunit